MTTSASMTTANPKITRSIADLIDKLPRKHSQKMAIKGSKSVLPWVNWDNVVDSWNWHLQGLAPYNGFAASIANGCLAASAQHGYFATFSQAPSQSSGHVQAVVVPDAAYGHAAGTQLLGDFLGVPLEGDKKNAKVVFYDVSNLAAPVELYSLQIPDEKASALAITNFTDATGREHAILAVYEYENHYMFFYDVGLDHIGGQSSAWEFMRTYMGDALQGDQFQCFSMVTETGPNGDQVYLVGFREDEEVHLFSVETRDANKYGELTKVAVYKGWDGSDWRTGGVALQIVDSSTVRILATGKDPHGSTDDYSIDLYIWAK